MSQRIYYLHTKSWFILPDVFDMPYTMTMEQIEFIDVGPKPEPDKATYLSMIVFLELYPAFNDPFKVDPTTHQKGLVLYEPTEGTSGYQRVYYEAIGTLLPRVPTRNFNLKYPLLDCTFPLYINDPDYIYSREQKEFIQVTRFKDFQVGDLIKVTGFLNGSLYGAIVTAEDTREEFEDDINFIAGYSIIANILSQKMVDAQKDGILFEFQFDIPMWKWAQDEPVRKRSV